MTATHTPAAPQFDAYQAARHFGSLDGLRFVCIFAVVWHHGPLSGPLREQFAFFGRGFVGVDFFFVLSGFLITTLLMREEARFGRFDLRSFYWRRLLRIVPIYFTIISAVALYYIGYKGQYEQAHLLPYYYLFLSNFLTEHMHFLDPTWSLSVEEQYYLLWPALLLLLPRNWIVPLVIVLIIVNVLGVLGTFAPLGIVPLQTGSLVFALPNATYAPILMGSLVAILLNRRTTFNVIAAALSGRFAPHAAFAALGIALALAPNDLRGGPNLFLHTLMCITLMTLVVREDNGLRWLMTRPLIVRVGQISYGIYLYHLFALHFSFEILAYLGLENRLAAFVLFCVLTFAIAELSFRTLERFFMQFRSRVKPRRPALKSEPDLPG